MQNYSLSKAMQRKLHFDLVTSGIDMSKAYTLVMCLKSIPQITEHSETSFTNVVKRKFVQSYDELEEFLITVEQEISNPNTYISVNTFFIPKATNTYIYRFGYLFADIDCHMENTYVTEHDLDSLYIHLCEEHFGKTVPIPSLIISTGRGLHLYWKIKPLPYNRKYITYWNSVMKNLLEVMDSLDFTVIDPSGKENKVFKVDKAVKNASRVLRLAGSFNSKARKFTDIVDINTNEYTLSEINQEYLVPFIKSKIASRKPKGKKTAGKKKNKR